jgi:MFS family permease
MTGRGGPYLRLLRRPDVLWPFGSAVVGRLPLAMAPLGMIVLVEEQRGSYASAGIVTAAFAWCTAISLPLWGSVIDRVGQSRVVALTSCFSAAFLAAMAVLAVNGAAVSGWPGRRSCPTGPSAGPRTRWMRSPSRPSSWPDRSCSPSCWRHRRWFPSR